MRRVVVTLEVPGDDAELVEVLENIDFVVAERARAGFKPALVRLLAGLRSELEAVLWADAGLAPEGVPDPFGDRSRSSS